jgi:DNA invertase Pin-like site-specific DNA recombinase
VKPAVRRCAIYTRKSTEEGLDQAFNSLDAQREACEAYIKSQAHEGWKLVKGAYDDGGFSGGNMERPGLLRLMAEVKQGLIDIVVVYKVDRLTRSLADFAKIVEVLDSHGASFVSVTQQFNTTTSMGRLTLNVLLSFAQFEREVTGERIRDKIAASKRKGMWMGGTPPLGYDIKDRQLTVNEADADTVRLIYRRYLELACVRALALNLRGNGIVSKVTISKRGRQHGGQPFGRGALYHLLRNRLYRGEIVHKEQAYPGQHPAIVPAELWDEVQQTLAANRSQHLRARVEKSTHLLSGRLKDDAGNPMIPTYSRKANGQQYRYYVSQGLLDPAKGPVGSVSRVPAEAVERLVEEEVIRRLSPTEQKRWKSNALADRAERLRMLVAKVVVREREIEIGLSEEVDPAHADAVTESGSEGDERVIKLAVAVKVTAGGKSVVTLDGHSPEESRLDRALLRAVARANHWRELLEAGTARSAYDLARLEGCRVSYVQRHLPLGFLAPDIVEAILAGRQPRSWMLADLVADQASMSWAGYRPA